MTEKICHKFINENIKTLCNETFESEKKYEKESESPSKNISLNCSSRCEELCTNINSRLQKIKDIVHLRSGKPNVILIETLNYIKEHIKEIEKYIQMLNKVIYEENKAYDYVQNIFNVLDKQNENIQKIYNICSQNIVITKNNNELIFQKPESCSSLSENFINNLLSVCKEENENKNNDCENPNVEHNEIKDFNTNEFNNESYIN
ncbi:hypothetical protein YYG_01015 [Plasmodium vinckei petteri]|uniref:Uncharacterized protein n=1 Tax=Plasmodium vinckei petteri TaxID=138298 RepID=W7APV2_PLAVN|nr:hypothetical protein YYG_01015 [Plasmodium vinckei petteri]CAD2106414.1 conserved Plasmodium protein, unknown function [Plasmodium vinckei petteri]